MSSNEHNHCSNNSDSSDRIANSSSNEQSLHFSRFLDTLDDYLYSQGWYINGYYIKKKCQTYDQVEQYLIDHCDGETKAREIVARIKLETL